MSTSIKIKRIFGLILIFFILLSYSSCFAVVKPTEKFYANDYGDMLNSIVEEYIVNTNVSLNEQTGAQIVVVTVKNLEGKSIEEYSTELFRKFGIGDSKKNNGVLILVSLEDRKSRIEVGYGLEGVLPDGKTGRIQDEYMIPYFKEDNWNEGIKNGYSKILEEVAKEYNVQVGAETPVAKETKLEMSDIIFIILIIIAIIINIKYGGGIYIGSSGEGGGFSSGGGRFLRRWRIFTEVEDLQEAFRKNRAICKYCSIFMTMKTYESVYIYSFL